MDLIYYPPPKDKSPDGSQVGIYTGKILKGGNPTNLPEMRSTV
jgi:hypothetical protein